MTVDIQPARDSERTDQIPETSGVILMVAIVLVLAVLAVLTT